MLEEAYWWAKLVERVMDVAGMRRRGRYRRGFSVAILVGFEENRAVLWQVYSNVAKAQATVVLRGTRKDDRAVYSFHESVVDALRPALKEGVRSIVIAAPVRTSFSRDFLNHVQRHHAWLIQARGPGQVAFGELVGSAVQPHDVAELVKTQAFQKAISETTSGEADHVIDTLEKCLNDAERGESVLYSLREIEDLLCSRPKRGGLRPSYLLLTDKYLSTQGEKSRLNRLLQISKNRGVKTRVVNAETPAGKRLSQLGGLVCLAELGQTDST
jgi:stalled ribosome rescue protein Dom34